MLQCARASCRVVCLLYGLGDEEFDELCFEFGIELDEVVRCILKLETRKLWLTFPFIVVNLYHATKFPVATLPIKLLLDA